MSRAIRAGAVIATLMAAVPGSGAERPRPHVPTRDALRPCPKQGAGFVRVPGSSTCIRISGRAVGGIDVGPHANAPITAGQVSIDTRTESDLGPFRAFVRAGHGRP